MLSLPISKEDGRPLVDQIVAGICRQIQDHQLRTGTKMPSIRRFAIAHDVSRFTVVEAYDRLVAMGFLRSRRGDGFYATARATPPTDSTSSVERKHNEQLVWLVRRLLEADQSMTLVGGPWLPREWSDDVRIRQTLGALGRLTDGSLVEYGNPYGYLPLRQHVAGLLGEIGITAEPSQIVLTAGASQALELVNRLLLGPGDIALVDDPGYYNLFGNLRLSNVQMLSVPRNPDGPDIASLERLAAEHRPKLYFTQSVLQNPTNTDMSSHVSFKVMQLAERYGFYVVEDDVLCDLQTKQTPRLASLDQLDRVIYARSFSKTLSGNLRVGFLACSQRLADEFADVKMLTSITSSQAAEQVIHLMLVDGHYRKHIRRLQERLEESRRNVIKAFERIGLELFVEPQAGMFLWARFPSLEDSMPLAETALREGFVLAPGYVFRPHLERSPWMRFNIAICDDARVQQWLERTATDLAAR
jgi:DNA-binding transcriptional MocR family regulator